MKDAWDEFLALAEDYRDLGDRVLFEGQLVARGLGSGVPVSSPVDILYDVGDGSITRMHSYLDHSEALRAAGLR